MTDVEKLARLLFKYPTEDLVSYLMAFTELLKNLEPVVSKLSQKLDTAGVQLLSSTTPSTSSEESHVERERADFVSRSLFEWTWKGAAIYRSAALDTYAGEWRDHVAALEDRRPPSLKSCSDSAAELQAWENRKSILNCLQLPTSCSDSEIESY